MDSGQSSQASIDPANSQASIDPAKTPVWYLDHGTDLHRDAKEQLRSESDPNKLIIFLRQCKYLVEQLETAIHIGRKSWERSLSPEHKAECGGALELLCRLAKEVRTFVWECCNESWMQAALTPASVPDHVSSWRWRLKVCSELLCNSNKLGAAWLTVAPHGGLREAEQLKAEQIKIKKMDSEDEDDLRRYLELMLDQSDKSKSNVLMQNVELFNIILERLKARHVIRTMDPGQSSSWEDSNRMMPGKVDLESLGRKERCIGRGSTAAVFKGEWLGAIKVAIRDKVDSIEDLNDSMRFNWLSHPNIVSYLGHTGIETLDSGFVVSEIVELMDGDLRTLMEQRMQEDGNRKGPFGIREACDLMLQVAEGVRYMHQNKVLHRNLKSLKILVRSSKDDTLGYTCAKVSHSNFPKRMEKSITDSVQTLNRGTTRWMAPELLTLRGVDKKLSNTKHAMLKHPFKLDVYSFGITCFEILTGELPFSDVGLPEIVRLVLHGIRPTLPQKTPRSLRNLIELCWDPEPKVRPSFAEICKELQYIKCSLLLEPQDHTPQVPLPPQEPLSLPPHVSEFNVDYSSLKVVRKLGSGGSDMVTVYLSTWLQRKIDVAQKHFMGSHNECFMNEVSIMAELKHPNVVRLLCCASDRRSCSIVMELMDGDLHDLIYRRRLEGKVTTTGPFSMADAVHVILQIARGMEYVHGQYVVHRDLKSCNILIKKASEGGKLEVKVADFGSSMKLIPEDTLLGKEESGVGTIRWMAPEVISVRASDPSLMYDPFKSDVFSFGMLCYEILVGRVPFHEVENLDVVRKNVLDGGRPTLPEWTPSYLKNLIEKCWVKEASERPTFRDIVEDLTKVRVETS